MRASERSKRVFVGSTPVRAQPCLPVEEEWRTKLPWKSSGSRFAAAAAAQQVNAHTQTVVSVVSAPSHIECVVFASWPVLNVTTHES